MTDIGHLLREGDPVAGEPFPASAVDGMQGRLRLEAERSVLAPEGGHLPWGTAWRAMTTALTCVVIVAITVLARRESPAAGPVTARDPDRVQAQRADRAVVADPRDRRTPTQVVPVRHLQFSTPEGIRVFWTFDPDFQENRR